MIKKFRAWNIKNNKMSNNFSFTNFDREYLITEAWYVDDIEIMQSTGLKDKNGEEIFEGDIVAWMGFKKRAWTKVEYSTRQAMFLPKQITFGQGVEVIGNKYENPELLAKVIKYRDDKITKN